MHLRTPDGYRTVRAGWPYEGLHRPTSAPLDRISLVGSRGQPRYATYRDIYLTNPWVWGAVNAIAGGAARAPIHTFALAEDGSKLRIRHDLPAGRGRPSAGAQLDRLMHYPNPHTSRRALVVATFKNRLVYGNALWVLTREEGPGATPTAIWRPSWRDVVVHEGTSRPVAYYEVTPAGTGADSTHFPAAGEFGSSARLSTAGRRYHPDDVVHFGRGTDDDTVAPSPLAACRHTLALHEAVVRHLIAFFENQARPSGYFKVDRLGARTAEAIRELITELYTSPENAGKVLVSSGEWKQITASADQSKVVELIELSRVEIAAAYAIPPPVLGILDRAIKSNVVELRSQYVRDAVGQPASEFEDEVMAQLVHPTPAWRHHFIEMQFAEQLRPDMEKRAEVHQKTRHLMSIDEQRAVENLPPLGIAGVTDVPWVDSGAQPVTAFSVDAVADRVAAAVAERLGSPNGHHHPQELLL
jgi:phage portal protein BeeE